MPNWCDNWITISGDKNKIKLIQNVLEDIKDKDEANIFMTLIGISRGLTLEEYEKSAWYNDNINNWGTKWDVSYNDCDFRFNEDNIEMSPPTAWSPPIEFGKQLATNYNVEVRMQYSEPGVDFAGVTICNPDGTFTEEDYSYLEGIYRQDPEQFWGEIDSNVIYHLEENPDATTEEFIEEYNLEFLTEEEKQEITEMINTEKSRNEKIESNENNIS